MLSKLTSLRPSQERPGERPARHSPRVGLVTPKGRVFLIASASVLLLLLLATPARATTPPPDRLAAILGAPSKPDGVHIYYLKTRFGHKFICRIWAYGTGANVRDYIEECVTPTRFLPKPTGPAS